MVFGLVQGLTEFLPISSSAHLRIMGELWGPAADPGAAFTAIIQIGTGLAVLLYFRREVVRIARGWWRGVAKSDPNPDGGMGWLIIIGTLPVVILGLVFTDTIETRVRSLYLVAASLIGFGLLLGLADKVGRQRKSLTDLGVRDGIIYGFAQALALIPGVSRSGGTITAGMLMGYTREAAARYAFLLAMPAIFGSGLYELVRAVGDKTATFPGFGPTLVATIVAFVVGYLVVIGFLKLVSVASYQVFVYYRVALGLVILVLLVLRVLSPVADVADVAAVAASVVG